MFAGRSHGLARADLFGWVHRLPGTVPLSLLHAGQVVGARRPGTETGADHIGLPLWSLPDVDAERYPGTREQPANPDELVFGQRVHRVDDDGADAWGRGFVLEGEGLADHGVEEALGLPRSGAGGDESGAALGDRSDRAFLVAVEVGDLLRNPLGEVRVDEAFADQLLDGSTGPEGAREADVRAPEEGGGAGMVEREKTAHLPEEVRIGEGVGGELVAEEALRDLLDVGDGVQGHGGLELENRCRKLWVRSASRKPVGTGLKIGPFAHVCAPDSTRGWTHGASLDPVSPPQGTDRARQGNGTGEAATRAFSNSCAACWFATSTRQRWSRRRPART